MSESASDGEAVDRYDVLRYGADDHRAVPAGDGREVVLTHEREADRQRRTSATKGGVLTGAAAGVLTLQLTTGLLAPLAVGLLVAVGVGAVRARRSTRHELVPELAAADVSAAVVAEYVDDFEPSSVSDPFGG